MTHDQLIVRLELIERQIAESISENERAWQAAKAAPRDEQQSRYIMLIGALEASIYGIQKRVESLRRDAAKKESSHGNDCTDDR